MTSTRTLKYGYVLHISYVSYKDSTCKASKLNLKTNSMQTSVEHAPTTEHKCSVLRLEQEIVVNVRDANVHCGTIHHCGVTHQPT